MAKGEKIHLRLDVELHEALNKMAARDKRSISNMINFLLHGAVFGKKGRAPALPNGHATELDDKPSSPPA